MGAPEALLLAAEFTAFQNTVERGSCLPPVEQSVCPPMSYSSAALLAARFASIYSRFAVVQLEASFVFLKGTLLETLKGFHLGNCVFYLQFYRNHQGL